MAAANETQNRAAESRASNDLSCFASSVPAFSFLHLAIASPLAPMSYRSATDLLTEPGSSRAPECLTLSSSGSAGGCSRFGRVSSLAGWDPWTNSRAQPAATRALRQQARQQPQQQPQQPSTLKAAGRLYDSILAAERKAAARSTNNNTTEMQCGLSDIQRHSNGGHRTTVITRLTSEMATSGGILDANFVIDTQSSNTELSPGSQDSADSSPDASSGSDNWRWTHPTPPDSQQRRASRASKDKLLTDSDSRDAGIGDQRNQPVGASLSMQQQKQKIRGGEVQSDGFGGGGG
ncbi:hypothetical protein BOX15_Mlig005673g3, partial [Macrostomum lignano]